MNFQEFGEFLEEENTWRLNLQKTWDGLSLRTRESLTKDFLLISIRKFNEERKSIEGHKCEKPKYCGGCLRHVCGLHGFGLGLYDYCEVCMGVGSIKHFSSLVEQLLFCPDLGISKPYYSEDEKREAIDRAKTRYGLI